MSDSPTPERERLLQEEVASAWRPRRLELLGSHPAWHDLSDDGRQEAFALATLNRRLEAALDPEGMNATVHAVLSRIRSGL